MCPISIPGLCSEQAGPAVDAPIRRERAACAAGEGDTAGNGSPGARGGGAAAAAAAACPADARRLTAARAHTGFCHAHVPAINGISGAEATCARELIRAAI